MGGGEKGSRDQECEKKSDEEKFINPDSLGVGESSEDGHEAKRDG